MNTKVIFGIIIIIVSFYFAIDSFNANNIEYTNFDQASKTGKKVQVKGTWLSELETNYDPNENIFSFYMKDDFNKTMKIVLYGAKPNNFELATSIVAKGRFRDSIFTANEILTKCPSKYEANSETIQKTL